MEANWIIELVLGFVIGKFCALPILISITIVAVGWLIYLHATLKEMAVLIAMAHTTFTGSGLVVMWVTYYLTTEQSFLSDFIHHYVLR